MKCWILYEKADLESNRFFAERLMESGNELGMECSIVTIEDADFDNVPDIVVSRIRDPDILADLEDRGATVYNSSSVCRICNDKALTYALVNDLGVPILRYSFPGEPLPDGPPWVVKSCYGHGGSEVFMAETEEQVAEYVEKLNGRKPIIQSFAEDPGKDLRVYVLAGKIIAAVLRHTDIDFRANVKLGASAEVVEPEEDVVEIVKKIVPELKADFVGIDFVFGSGWVYLNEIEDVVGTRMLYSLTKSDPARMYMNYIAHSKMSL